MTLITIITLIGVTLSSDSQPVTKKAKLCTSGGFFATLPQPVLFHIIQFLDHVAFPV